MGKDEHSSAEVITDLWIMVLSKNCQDILEGKVDGGAENCILLLRTYRRMFQGNFTNASLPKANALQNVFECCTDCILSIHRNDIIQDAHYITGKLIPIQFCVRGTKNEEIILHAASTQLGLLKVLCHNGATNLVQTPMQSKKAKPQPEKTWTMLLPAKAMTLFQDHKIVNNIQYLKYIYPHSFDKIGSMLRQYSISQHLNIQPVQSGRCRVLIKSEEEIKAQLREMMTKNIITPQVKSLPLMSVLIYPHKANRSLTVCLDP